MKNDPTTLEATDLLETLRKEVHISYSSINYYIKYTIYL